MDLSSITYATVDRNSLGAVTQGNSAASTSTSGPKNPLPTEDTVNISQEGKEKASRSNSSSPTDQAVTNKETTNLNQQELQQLQQLKQRDTEVRNHEQAHLSAAGRYARGGASFTYQKGPDGASYAIGGEVGIDVSKESNPEATIAKMQTIKRAALAPADPSGADKRIAAQANAKEAQARQELLQTQQEELLRGESVEDTSAMSQSPTSNTDSNNAVSATTSSYGSLKIKMAAYEKMAAN